MPAQMDYLSALQSLRDGQAKFRKMVNEYAASVAVLENKIVAAANKAAAEVEPMVRGFLVQNLRASGLKLGHSEDGSMPLTQMVAATEVVLIWKGLPNKPTGVTLKYQMPAGLAEQAYKKISSLNYGAVRTNASNRGVIGEKRKRSLKKALWNSRSILGTGAAITPRQKRQATWFKKAGIDITKASFKGASIRVGGFSATRAWRFFHLNDSQANRVIAAFTIALNRELSSIPD